MTTPLSSEQLDQLLRSCVHCGLCLPSCATYLATGDETFSPRGRLLLLGEVVTGGLDPEAPGLAESFGTCLGCMACSSTCPSGVSFDLLETLNAMGQTPTPVTGLLDRPGVLRILRGGVGAARTLLRVGFGADWRRRLDAGPRSVARLVRLLGIMPDSPDHDGKLLAMLDRMTGLTTSPTDPPAPAHTDGPHLAWFTGCADAALLPGTQRRLGRLLTDLGCILETPADQVCCGAVAAHTGRPERAQQQHQRNLEVFDESLARCDHVLVASAGCGRELQRHDDALSGRTVDAAVLLDRLAPANLGAVPLRVALHDPCHARHGQGIVAEPRRLLRRIPGLRLLEPVEADVCCGGAGVFGVEHPELAAAMGRRKALNLLATGCQLVVTTNPGCQGHIADALALTAPGVPILPLSDLVWYAWQRGLVGRTTP